jgi:Holliday junction DNA helicase RuvA
MIGKLTGYVDYIDRKQGCIVLELSTGMGYVVWVHGRLQHALPLDGTVVSLIIETIVREGDIALYGFSSYAEKEWFRLLMTVQGVGAKVAMAILESYRSNELSAILAHQDKTKLQQVSGIGPKLALRIVTELKDKTISVGQTMRRAAMASSNGHVLMDDDESDASLLPATLMSTLLGEHDGDDGLACHQSNPSHHGLIQDGISALVHLGYHKIQATEIVNQIISDDNINDLATLIRVALQRLSSFVR